MTVEEYLDHLDHWLAERVPGTVTTRTEDYYRQLLRLQLKPLVGHLRLIKLAPADVSRMLTATCLLSECRVTRPW
jgi:hypothetical protein